MSLYALSDLHLSFTHDKPMGIFGDNWLDHDKKIEENWKKIVKEEDTVLIGGDISWSMTHEESREELQFIHELPGRKILIKGNHDYWWTSIKKLNSLYDNMDFIQNNYFVWEDYVICGTRGWVCEGSEKFTSEDLKIYKREAIRLENSIKPSLKEGKKIIAMIHYPPFNEKGEDSVFTEIFESYSVEKVIYGHLHGPSLKGAFNGIRKGVEYLCTSSDYLNFKPKLLVY